MNLHYKQHSIECINLVENYNFNVGNALKYAWRLGLKEDVKSDLKKICEYCTFESKRIQARIYDKSKTLKITNLIFIRKPYLEDILSLKFQYSITYYLIEKLYKYDLSYNDHELIDVKNFLEVAEEIRNVINKEEKKY